MARAFGKSTVEAAKREMARLAALDQLDLLDAPRDDGFDRLVRLIRKTFDVEIGIVSLIDAHRQWYLSCSGLSNSEMPRNDTFCRYVLETEEPLVIPDTTKDSRFAANPAVTGEAGIRSYIGAPIMTGSGLSIGTVCAIDRRPRGFRPADVAILEEIAGIAMDRIDLMQSASTDSLTGTLTRRAFKAEADQLISLSLRHHTDLSCIVLDVDHFKAVNDNYGHGAGDEVLKAVAATCSSVLRAGDLLGRQGGEEFAIVLPNVSRDDAVVVAEKLRAAIGALKVAGDFGVVQVTASFGVATLSIIARDIETLLAQADAAMYEAKRTGRNRCLAWSSVPGSDSTGARRRVLKAGTILFNNRRSTIDCTIKTLGSDCAGLSVSRSTGIPPEFVLMIPGDAFETNCRVISQDQQNIEVAFR